jgi:hypothetical protein
MKVTALVVATLVLSAPPLTRQVPNRVRDACASLRAGVTVPVRCPRLVPAGPLNTDIGIQKFTIRRKLYLLDVRTVVSGRELHWIVGGGEPRMVQDWVIDGAENERPGKAVLVGKTQVGQRVVRIYRFPKPPKGGPNGGHVGAFVRVAGGEYFATTHGWEHENTAVAILTAMLPK